MVYRTKLPETASVANSKGGVRLFAPSAERNSTPIVNLIKQIAPKSGEAFEIASGTGQHIVKLALSIMLILQCVGQFHLLSRKPLQI